MVSERNVATLEKTILNHLETIATLKTLAASQTQQLAVLADRQADQAALFQRMEADYAMVREQITIAQEKTVKLSTAFLEVENEKAGLRRAAEEADMRKKQLVEEVMMLREQITHLEHDKQVISANIESWEQKYHAIVQGSELAHNLGDLKTMKSVTDSAKLSEKQLAEKLEELEELNLNIERLIGVNDNLNHNLQKTVKENKKLRVSKAEQRKRMIDIRQRLEIMEDQ